MLQTATAPSPRSSTDRFIRFARTLGTLVPDAISAAVVLMLVVAICTFLS